MAADALVASKAEAIEQVLAACKAAGWRLPARSAEDRAVEAEVAECMRNWHAANPMPEAEVAGAPAATPAEIAEYIAVVAADDPELAEDCEPDPEWLGRALAKIHWVESERIARAAVRRDLAKRRPPARAARPLIASRPRGRRPRSRVRRSSSRAGPREESDPPPPPLVLRAHGGAQ